MGTDKIGIIGGSGLYAMAALEDVREVEVTTPFGPPSDAYILGTLHGREMVFLPRHGRGHRGECRGQYAGRDSPRPSGHPRPVYRPHVPSGLDVLRGHHGARDLR